MNWIKKILFKRREKKVETAKLLQAVEILKKHEKQMRQVIINAIAEKTN